MPRIFFSFDQRPFFLLLLLFAAFPTQACKSPGLRQDPTTSSWSSRSQGAAPTFSLQDLQGRNHDLQTYRGKVILLNFWATWCQPCLKEMPHFQTFEARYQAQGLQILAVNTDEAQTQAQVGPTVHRMGFRFPVLLDSDGRVVSIYNPKRHNPFTVLIDRQGQIRGTHQGYNPGDEITLERHLLALLKESSP